MERHNYKNYPKNAHGKSLVPESTLRRWRKSGRNCAPYEQRKRTVTSSGMDHNMEMCPQSPLETSIGMQPNCITMFIEAAVNHKFLIDGVIREDPLMQPVAGIYN